MTTTKKTIAEIDSQARSNNSYVIGMYKGLIGQLLQAVQQPHISAAEREVLSRMTAKFINRGEAIFLAHGQKTYEEVLAELEAKNK